VGKGEMRERKESNGMDLGMDEREDSVVDILAAHSIRIESNGLVFLCVPCDLCGKKV
jgi:hypothetical protein